MMGYTLHRQTPPLNERSAMMISDKSDKVYDKGNKISTIYPRYAWEKQRCFIIGGGESLKGFDFSRLDGELTIGINRSYEFFDSTLLYMMDLLYQDKIVKGEMDRHTRVESKKKFQNFKGTKIMLCPVSPYPIDSSIHLIRRIEKRYVSLDIWEGIFGGSNSGFGALMLAIVMGASPIYLLGFDMKCGDFTHWHNGYPGQNSFDQNKKNESFRLLFEEFAPVLEKIGFKIINLNKDSALNCFEFGDINEVLKSESLIRK